MQFATITIIIEILFYLVLCAGVIAQLRKAYHWHDRLQAPIVILNIFFILFVMVPTFRAVVFNPNSEGLTDVPTFVTLIHGVLGAIAQLLAIYCLLAGFKILPRKIGVLRYWMWATFVAWTATVLFGVGIYLVYYVNDSSAGGAAAPAAPPLATAAPSPTSGAPSTNADSTGAPTASTGRSSGSRTSR